MTSPNHVKVEIGFLHGVTAGHTRIFVSKPQCSGFHLTSVLSRNCAMHGVCFLNLSNAILFAMVCEIGKQEYAFLCMFRKIPSFRDKMTLENMYICGT